MSTADDWFRSLLRRPDAPPAAPTEKPSVPRMPQGTRGRPGSPGGPPTLDLDQQIRDIADRGEGGWHRLGEEGTRR